MLVGPAGTGAPRWRTAWQRHSAYGVLAVLTLGVAAASLLTVPTAAYTANPFDLAAAPHQRLVPGVTHFTIAPGGTPWVATTPETTPAAARAAGTLSETRLHQAAPLTAPSTRLALVVPLAVAARYPLMAVRPPSQPAPPRSW